MDNSAVALDEEGQPRQSILSQDYVFKDLSGLSYPTVLTQLSYATGILRKIGLVFLEKRKNITKSEYQHIAPDLSQLNKKNWNLDSRASVGGPYIIDFPASIPDGAYLLSVNKSSSHGIFQVAEVKSFQVGSKMFYDLQICVDTGTGATQSTWNVRSTEIQAQEATAAKETFHL